MFGSKRVVSVAGFVATAYLMWDTVEASRPGNAEEASFPPRSAAEETVKLPNPAELVRNPFLPPGEEDPSLEGDAANPVGAWRLAGVVATRDRRLALIDGQAVKEGDSFKGYVVDSIQWGRVILSRDGEAFEVTNVTAAPVATVKAAPPSPPATLTLSAVVTSPALRAAIINGHVVREGDTWEGMLLESIGSDGVRVLQDGRQIDLKVSGPDRRP
jgi:hypothetical protein